MRIGAAEPALLSWERKDIERRLGFRGTKYTGANSFLTFMMGALGAVVFYAAMVPVSDSPVGRMFFERGCVPYAIVFFTGWSLAILLIKWRKLALQKQALTHSIVPETPEFVLSPNTAGEVLRKLYQISSNPKPFLLLNRIERSLSNLKNIGRVADVDEIMRSHAENDEKYVESTYILIRGFIWAIPVLGFIGTVLGLSDAIGGFGAVLAKGTEISELKTSLQGVTGGLSTAFETTLIGLVAALGIQLLLTVLRKHEDDFLDSCSDYCHEHIVSRLRTIPVEPASDGAKAHR
jgi:biopolymer transport protein ExbB/TolQ